MRHKSAGQIIWAMVMKNEKEQGEEIVKKNARVAYPGGTEPSTTPPCAP